MSSSSDRRLTGLVAVVSGGAGGLGAAFCRRFIAEGAKVVSADVLDDDGETLVAELGDRALSTHLDVASERSWGDAMETACRFGGGVDVLVNNAGVLRGTPIEGGDEQLFRELFAVNQLGVYLGMRAAVDPMRERGGGSIINISSIDGMVGMPGMAAYVASKWAVRGMTKVAAVELGPLGIRCNSIHPGYIDTPMLRRGGRVTQAFIDGLAESVPAKRLGTPEDVADVAAFLASSASTYCNGAEIVVDGGLIAGFSPIDRVTTPPREPDDASNTKRRGQPP